MCSVRDVAVAAEAAAEAAGLEVGLEAGLETGLEAGLEEAATPPTVDSADGAPPAGAPPAEWADTPVYIGTERWGRGLDLELDYVFLLAPPASSASYAHLAGRTARKGRSGTAVTLLTPSQAPRVVAFAEALGLSFSALGEGGG